MSARTGVLWITGETDESPLVDRPDVRIHRAADRAEAADVLASVRVDCIVCPHEREGNAGAVLLERLGTTHPHVPSVLVSERPDDDLASTAANGSITEYLPLAIWDDPGARLADRVHALAAAHDPTHPDERTLSGLLATARELMTTRAPDDIATVVADAASDILEYDSAAVWLVDDHEEVLRLAAGSAVANYGVGEGPVGTAYETGEPSVRETESDATMYFPLGDHGVLAVTADSVRAMEDADVQLAEILAANASAAFGRASREQALELYQTVVDNVREMVYVLDEDGRVVLASQQILDAAGYDRDEIIGEHVSKFFTPEGLQKGTGVITEMLAEDDPGNRTYRTEGIRADGTRIPVEIELSLLPTGDGEFRGTIGAIRDISDLVETEERLEHERDRFRSLFRHIPDPVVDTRFEDGEPVIEGVNPAFERVFGHEATAVVGRSVNDVLVPAGDEETGRELDRQTLEDAPTSAEVRRETADGERFFLFRGIPYRAGDGATHAFGIYTDISDQRDRERHLQVLHRVLRHNLRTDMAVVIGYLGELADDLTDEAHLALIERVTGRAEDAARLADKVHQLEQVVRRDSELTPEPIDVTGRIESLVTRFREVESDATIRFSSPERCIAYADERLDLAVENLVENSIEHTPGEAPTVAVTVERTDEYVEIGVADDGPGIPEHERALLTGDRDVTRVEHGDGLGLWVVNWVARSLGGDVTFGDPEVGSEVVLRLRPEED
ncbi:PAS domain S-box protein [Haloarchaeobius amylolyticus]|uniref:PAS domain S-box protein n=1 Tax=Haloarchaeobius amylolyticus TaxID=1198296 RepID=UPI00226FB293|nr:PAS domain S-box protein [Haloarchaeobius amylolyticus]